MGFKIHLTDDGRVPGIEYYPADGLVPKVGMALAFSGGVLAVASGSTAPGYIAMTERDEAVEEGEAIPVIRVSDDIIFSAMPGEDMSSAVLGDSVTVGEDGLTVSAGDGAAVLVGVIDPAEGGEVLVRFIPAAASGAAGASVANTKFSEVPDPDTAGAQE